jgi:hypothetical protein
MTNKAVEICAWRLAMHVHEAGESGFPSTINHITLAGGMSRRQVLSNRSRRTHAIHPT